MQKHPGINIQNLKRNNKPVHIRHGKKNANKELKLLGVLWGSNIFGPTCTVNR